MFRQRDRMLGKDPSKIPKRRKNVRYNEKTPHASQCTMCPFESRFKNTFQRHLMKTHGVKLKHLEEGAARFTPDLGRVTNDYVLNHKFVKLPVSEYQCWDCNKGFHSSLILLKHKQFCKTAERKAAKALFTCSICQFPFSHKKQLDRHVSKCGKTKNLQKNVCPNCKLPFKEKRKLVRHVSKCGKSKDVCCQLCPFKSLFIEDMQMHFINKHNLLVKPVDEPDFEQALNGTPYTLERVIELDVLPVP